MTINKIDLESKKEALQTACNNLKSKFIGLDDIIDKIHSFISTWYILPELLNRPIVINLWGMTGVGKTDLVRQLVNELGMQNSFSEIQLNIADYDYNNIKDSLELDNISSEQQGILLLDEIQRFSSLDEHGNQRKVRAYSDIWELLSDGSFSDAHKEKEKLYGLYLSMLYNKSRPDEDDDEKPSPKSKVTNNQKGFESSYFNISEYEAKSFKRAVESPLPVEEIMKLSTDERILILEQKIKNRSSKPRKVFNRLLIFICGNLDDVYSGLALNVDDINTDADILHNRSKEISILDVKKGLLKYFYPEQIARFGNNHIIYPSLSKKSYEKLIDVELTKIISRTKSLYGIDILFNKEVNTVIYNNSVYPTQGTRPVFSSINSIIENTLPNFLIFAINNNCKSLYIDVDTTNYKIICRLNDSNKAGTIEIDSHFEIDKLKSKFNINERIQVIVHECGHLLMYAMLFKVLPSQFSFQNLGDSLGFVILYTMIQDKTAVRSSIKVLLSATIAEKLILGGEHRHVGCTGDIQTATEKVALLVRRTGLLKNLSYTGSEFIDTSQWHNNDMVGTSKTISKYLDKYFSQTEKLLKKNLLLLKELIKLCWDCLNTESRNVSMEEILSIVIKYLPETKLVPIDTVLSNDNVSIIERL